MIVTVTPTIMDGTVVRWYLDEAAEDRRDALISASRNGVAIGPHCLRGEVLIAAQAAHEALRRDPNADMSHLATHEHRGVFSPLVKIERVSADG